MNFLHYCLLSSILSIPIVALAEDDEVNLSVEKALEKINSLDSEGTGEESEDRAKNKIEDSNIEDSKIEDNEPETQATTENDGSEN